LTLLSLTAHRVLKLLASRARLHTILSTVVSEM